MAEIMKITNRLQKNNKNPIKKTSINHISHRNLVNFFPSDAHLSINSRHYLSVSGNEL